MSNAERYYRSMFEGSVSSWNVRDRHMVETLGTLVDYLDGHLGTTKVVVWAHNSHLGDAGATEMGERGEVNVGQLIRERFPKEAVLIGFTTYHGTVTAASDWGARAERKRVRPALRESYEELFHKVTLPQFWINLRGVRKEVDLLRKPRLERAIGVIYRPETESSSHNFETALLAR